jgi:hypothetical protein
LRRFGLRAVVARVRRSTDPLERVAGELERIVAEVG